MDVFSRAGMFALALAALTALSCEERATPVQQVAASATATATAAAEEAPADLDDPATCARCHEAIVAEFAESMHARAHHSRDPIYAGVRELRAKREGEAVTKACANCHTPRDLDNAESAVAKRGVTCSSCHAVQSVAKGKLGAMAMKATKGNLLLGPHDIAADKTPAHATGNAPAHMLDTNALCAACHQKLDGPAGVPICETGIEHDALAEKGTVRKCVDCHMRQERGPSGSAVARTSHASHRFLGPHRAWYQDDAYFLKSAADMKAVLEKGKLTVTLTNESHHAMPTGFPGRMAMVTVEGMAGEAEDVIYRDEGKVKNALLRKKYVDADGKPTLAPWAKELKIDTRLKAGETRELVFEVPDKITRARVRLVFRLLPPPLAKKLGLSESVEATPKVAFELDVER